MSQIPRWLKLFVIGQILIDVGFIVLLAMQQSNINAISDWLFG